MGSTRLRIAALVAVVFTLASCSTQTSRYSQKYDSAPKVEFDASVVPDAIPRHENRTSAGNKSPYTVMGKEYRVLSTEKGYKETGTASWYGEKFHGHKTSNGETYDMYKMTAAHKSLPIPCYARVTNLTNNRSVVVRINDRGPFHDNRLIDLSFAAAKKLGITNKGTGNVTVEAIAVSESKNGPKGIFLQVAAFQDMKRARTLASQLAQNISTPVFILSVHSQDGKKVHRVNAGPYNDETKAQQERDRVEDMNLGNGIVLRK